MAKIKPIEIRRMTKAERTAKLEELKMELLKARVDSSKTGSSKVKEIKRLIARMITLNK